MSASSSWSGGNLPSAGDTIRINGACIVDNAFSNLAYGRLEVSRTSTGSISWPVGGTATLNVTTVLNGSAGAGSIDMTNGGTLQIRSGWTSSNTAFTAGTGTVNWNTLGANTTLPSAISAYNKLTITASTGTISLGTATTVGGTLTLTSGTFAVGANTLTLNGPAIAGTSANLSTTSSSSLVFGGSSSGVSVPGSVSLLNNLTVNNASGVLLGGSVTIGGALTLTSGTLTVGTNTLTLNGPAIAGTATNLVTSSGSSLSFGGSSSGISIPSTVTALTNLTVNNANGVTSNSNLTLSGTLALTSGTISTGSNKIAVSSNCSTSVTRSAGYVIGYLKLTFPAGATTTCTYHVGTGSAYAPIGMTMVTPSVSGGGTLTGTTVGNEHPQVASSGIDSTKDVNRYWSLWATGDTISFSSYAATFNFIAGDKDSTATAGNFVIGKYVGSTWSRPTPVTAGSTSTAISGVTAALTGTTDFVAGETEFTCLVPSDLPSGMSCVCDSFSRTTLNPSTIFDSDWILSSSGLTTFIPSIVNSGFLRLTSNSQDVATAATMPGTFPAAGNMVTVEFKHYAYDGGGADGIALTLSDANITPVPGAYGGSLGYAQKTGINGFAGGWIGVGIDEYGNFTTSTEGRSGGTGTVLIPDSVTVRGSGSGAGAANNYPFLANTGTLSPGIDNPASGNAALGHAYRITVDARCYERNTSTTELNCNNPTLGKKAQVTVHRDTTGAGNFSNSNRIVNFDAYSVNPSQAGVPSNWKLSFTGSTGSITNIHEVASMRICGQTITPPSGFRIQIDNYAPSTCAVAGGSPAAPVITVTAVDASDNVVTSYTGTVTLSAKLENGSTSNAVWSKKSGNGTFTASTKQYQFVASDSGTAQFYLTDANTQDVYVSVSDGSLSSSVAAPVQFSGGLFTVAYPDSLGTDVVAGRAHRISVSRTTCTGGANNVDTSYTGTKALDGWYNPDGNHPSGAAAPKICATNGSNTCIGGTGSCTTLAIAAPTLSSTSNNLSLAFSQGVANFCLVTSDVGKYSVSVRDDSNTSSPIVGASLVLTPKPFTLAVSNIKQGSTLNTGGTAAGGDGFVAAGDTFQATVGAYLWSSAADANVSGGDGVPDTGSSLANVTAGGLAASYRWPVVLRAADTGFTPAIGDVGSLGSSNSVTVTANEFSAGAATKSTLTYSEVGSFTLSGSATGFLNTNGINPTALVFDGNGANNSVVGRFFPDHFTLVTSAVTPACAATGLNSFTYMGQPFGYGFQIEARNKSDLVTSKYVNTVYADTATVSVVAEDSDDGTDLGGNVTQPSGTWAAGVYDFNTANALLATYTRPAAATRSLDALQLGVQVTGDGDGATLAGRDMRPDTVGSCGTGCSATAIGGSTIRQRFGRLRLANAHGSELLSLRVPVEAQYFNGTAFVTNGDDSCTSIVGNTVSMGNYQRNLGPVGGVCKTRLATNTTLVGGRANLILTAPGANNNGSVDLTINLGAAVTGAATSCVAATETSATSAGNAAFLQGSWAGGAFTDNPVARATFGVQKSGPVIYIREMH